MEPPPPVKEAREVESAAPKIGNLAGFGGGGSSDPVEPATFSDSLTMNLMETVVGHRLFIMNNALMMNEEKVVNYYLF
jgi:hypothetical protein